MYRVKSIMGDTAFQVIKEPNVIIRTFYTEPVAKDFCDRLIAEEYFERFERFVYPIVYDEPFNEAIKNIAYNQALEDALKVVEWDGYTLDIKKRIEQLKR